MGGHREGEIRRIINNVDVLDLSISYASFSLSDGRSCQRLTGVSPYLTFIFIIKNIEREI